MAPVNTLREDLLELLPNRGSRIVASTTATIAIALATQDIQVQQWPTEPESILLMRILVPTIVLLLGSWVTFFFVLNHYLGVLDAKPKPPLPKPAFTPGPLHIELLRHIHQYPGTSKTKLAQITKRDSAIVSLHLDELSSADFIYNSLSMATGSHCYLDTAGTRYLMSIGAIS